MADVHNKKTRSYNMSQIRAKNTKPELTVRKFLFSHGFRYRLNVKRLPGAPDIVLAKYKTVLFINGCFWHGHDSCKYFVIPKTRTEWWVNKINKTRERDEKNIKQLRAMNWKIIIVWECELKENAMGRLERLINEIKRND